MTQPPPDQGPFSTAAAPMRVLIIEDNVDSANSLREALEFGGHQVVVAYNGIDGLAAARRVKPEVVLCDIGLPGLDGYDVARAIRAEASLGSPLLIALTGYALPEDVQKATSAGFERHLSKPPDIERIEGMLKSARLGARPT